MDSEIQKIKKLWEYLKIQDEHLIIQLGGKDSNDEVLLVSKNDEGALNCIYTTQPLSEWIMQYNHPFVLIKQRDRNGRFIIPDIDEWKRDEELDY